MPITGIPTPDLDPSQNRKPEKPEKSPQPTHDDTGNETFGNEPPVKDPSPAKQPDRYEM